MRYAVAASLTALSLTLNASYANWGLPGSWHPDEVVDEAMRLVAERTLDPNFFQYPSLHIYLVALVIVMRVGFMALGNLLSGRSALANIDPGFWELRPDLLLSARLLTAAMGAASVWLVYRITREVFDAKTALLAAVLLTLSAGFIGLSHFATVDVPLVFWSLLALAVTLRAFDRCRPGWFFCAGIVAGLAASTKYPGAVAAVPLLLAAAQCKPSLPAGQSLWRYRCLMAGLAVSGALVGFFVGTPYALLRFPRFAADFLQLNLYQPNYMGAGRIGFLQHWWNVANMCGVFGCAAAIAGVAYVTGLYLKQRNTAVLLLLAAFAGVYAITGRMSYCPDRYTLPLLPFLMIFGAKACMDLIRAASRGPGAIRIARATLAVGILYTAFYGGQAVFAFRYDDRVLASDWLRRHARPTDSIEITAKYRINVPSGYEHVSLIPYSFSKETFEQMRQSPTYRWLKARLPWVEFNDYPTVVSDEPREASLEALLTRRPKYLVLSGRCYSNFVKNDAFTLRHFPLQHRMYNEILSNATGYKPVADFRRQYGWLRPRLEQVDAGVTVYQYIE